MERRLGRRIGKPLRGLVARVATHLPQYRIDYSDVSCDARSLVSPWMPQKDLALAGRPWTSATKCSDGKVTTDPGQRTSSSTVLRSQCYAAGFVSLMPRAITNGMDAPALLQHLMWQSGCVEQPPRTYLKIMKHV